jgi:glycosyltransferase involved in cell wall biosynthesis
MRIDAYIQVWNREDTIALTIKHYKQFCEKIFIYDNFSTDNTRDIAYSLGCEVVLFGQEGILDDQAYKTWKNNAWKGSDADWVIVVDDDEILYSEDLVFILKAARMNGETIFKPQGISVHSNLMPVESWLDIRTGWEDNNYSKLCVFDPSKVDIGFEYGCHTHMNGFPKGKVHYGKETLYLLHYNFVGGVDRLIKRWAQYEPRRQRSAINLRWNMGHRYAKSEKEIRKEWSESGEKSKSFSDLGIG